MKQLGLFLCAFLIFSFAACKSTPKAEDSAKMVEAADAENTSVAGDSKDAASRASAARAAAIEAGADTLGPAYDATEAMYAAAKNANAYDAVAARYRALETYAKAMALKKRIDTENLADYSRSDYAAGEEALKDLDKAFADKTITGEALQERAQKAYTAYNKVLNIAYRQLAMDARMQSIEAKRRADSVMAGVAAKDDYGRYIQEMRMGDSGFSMQNTVSAYEHYTTAAAGFEKLYETVSERRAVAESALTAARRRTRESAQFAASADKEAPITDENMNGIEEEGAVLLEEEMYEDPKKSVIDIPDTIDANAAGGRK